MQGALALLERSLRLDARAWGPHLARLGLMITIYGALLFTIMEAWRFGAPGLRFFHSMSYMNLTFISLLGLSFFSTAITEEKEEDTLGLMLMAGISPLGILLGKSGSRLIQALLLVAVQYPFTLLAITMGGISPVQVQAMYVGMLAYVVMLAGLGLLSSTISARNKTASIRLMLVVIVYILIPLLCSRLIAKIPSMPVSLKTVLSWTADSCVFLQMGTILTTGFGESIFSRQVISNLLLGVIGFLCSWLVFPLAANQPSTEAIVRGPLDRSGMFSPQRPWGNPVIWKDFYFVGGGEIGVFIRVVGGLGVFLLAWLIDELSFTGSVSNRLERISGIYLFLMCLVVPVDAGNLVVRSLHEELRSQTLTTLFLLPIPAGKILYSKIIGAMIPWIPGLICLLGSLFLLPGSSRRYTDFGNEPEVFLWLVSLMVLLPHIAAILSTLTRWGALPIAICTTIGCMFLSVMIFSGLRVPRHSPVVFFVAALFFLASAMCHVFVRLRSESLSTR